MRSHHIALAALLSCGPACSSNEGTIGGTDEDTGSSVGDSTGGDSSSTSDTSTTVDSDGTDTAVTTDSDGTETAVGETSAGDTAIGDTGKIDAIADDTAVADTAVADTAVADSGSDTGSDTGTVDTGSLDTGSDTGSGTTPTLGGCPIFTASDAWNRTVTSDSVDTGWTATLYANAIAKKLHPDFGSGFGIPFNIVASTQTKLPMLFDIAGESDPGPYPFPGATAKIEGGSPTACTGDCHVLTVQQGLCLLYEGWDCHYTASPSSWHCGSGAKFDLTKNSYGQRPTKWTSADAAGLAVLPGLVRYSEVAAGVVNHAIRFTMHCTQDGFIAPASHFAVPTACGGLTGTPLRTGYPPMGTRMRLKSTFDISTLPAQAKVIAQAMKTYGMILADNGSDYYFQGDDDPSWNDTQLNALKAIDGNQFEVLTVGTITH